MDWRQLVVEPLRLLVERFVVFVPKVVGALVILVVGWAVAGVLRRVVVRLLQVLKVDRLAEKARLSDVLRQGAIRLSTVELFGQLGYWLVMIATIIVALQFVGVTVAAEWLERFGYFIPRLVVSLVILLFGMLVASFLGATVRAASFNAGFPQGHLVGQVVYTTVVLLTVIVALEQLQVVTRTIEVALYILLAAFGLAFALALGLGSQGIVKRFLEDMLWEKWKFPKEP
jgi:hypothetical protein